MLYIIIKITFIKSKQVINKLTIIVIFNIVYYICIKVRKSILYLVEKVYYICIKYNWIQKTIKINI